MLATIDLDNQALLKADEIKDLALERHLTTKLELCKAPIAKQAPHRGLRIGRLATHVFRKIADVACC